VVGISDRSVARAPDTIVTYALGSCVGVALYDEAAGVGGLAHIMLPESSGGAGASGGGILSRAAPRPAQNDGRSDNGGVAGASGDGAGDESSGAAIVGAQYRMRYADTGVEDLALEMQTAGAARERIVAKIAGGANMFRMADDSPIASIGDRNVRGVRDALGRLGIPVVAEDTGRDYGRTMHFDLGTGKVMVQALGRNSIEI
jgi:chemotaxis protein CheD